MTEKNPNSTTFIGSSGEIKRRICDGRYKITDKRGRSAIWEFFGPIANDNGEEIENVVGCKICKNVYKFSKNGTSNLTKHKCFMVAKNENEPADIDVSQDQKKQCTKILTEWVTGDCRPYSIVKDEGLANYTKFILSLGATCGSNINTETLIADPTTLSRNAESIYNIHFQKLKQEIAKIKDIGYGLTSDVWTDNFVRISYVALTVHYILEGELKSKLLGIKSMKGLSNTGFNIRNKIESLLNDYDCSLEDSTIIVTDRGTNMKAALKEYENIFCVNHLINNIIEKSINNTPQIQEILTLSSKLVKYFKRSGDNCSLVTTLKSVCPTRWNTQYYTLLSIQKNFCDIQTVLVSKNMAEDYALLNAYYIDQILNVLRPFEEVSKKLEGASYATLHLVHAYVQQLKTKCSASDGELDFIADFKKNLSELLKSVVEANISIFHKIAIFLFPPANQLTQFQPIEKTEIINKCKNLMMKYKDDIPRPNAIETLSSSGIFQLFQPYARQEEISDEHTLDNEIHKYQNTIVPLHENFDILEWWYARQNEFPLLFRLCCFLLAVPASSAPSERILSKARNVITDKRSQMGVDSESFNEIMFLNVNVKNK